MSYYEPLTRFLETRAEGELSLSFRDVEAILRRNLPASARKHQAWWANTTSHSHADSWLRPEWKTAKVDIAAERVVFERSGQRASGPSDLGAGLRRPLASGPTEYLSAAARRLVEDYAAQMDGDVDRAIARAVHEAAIARRAQRIDKIVAGAPRANDNSVDLIREDRDAR